MTKKNTTTTATDGTATKPKTKRPRAGEWTPFVKQIPIPGTDEVMDVEFYRVEFAGEVCEVRHDRAGVKRGNHWIRDIKRRGEEGLKVYDIRKKLEALAATASTPEVRDRLMAAANLLGSDCGPDETP